MNNVAIILVEPLFAGNVASIVRIMNNFEFTQLRIVGEMPTDGPFYMAVHSEHILDDIELFPSLEEAISDRDRVIAFSRRKGKLKKVDMIPSQVADYVHKSIDLNIGLVFGRESWGLTDEEASLCPLRCYIKANPNFPSLNLSQSVTVVLYELYGYEQKSNIRNYKFAKKSDIDDTHSFIMKVLDSIGIDREKDVVDWEHFFHNLFSRANLTTEMATRLKQLFNRIHAKIKGNSKNL